MTTKRDMLRDELVEVLVRHAGVPLTDEIFVWQCLDTLLSAMHEAVDLDQLAEGSR